MITGFIVPGVAQGADQPARQRADVGAPVAADLGLVAHAAERHADELATRGARDRLADRRLARAGRADQREDRAGALVLLDAALLAQLADGDVLDDPVLDVLEARRGRRRAPHARGRGRAARRTSCPTAAPRASRGRCGSSTTRPTARPSARGARAPSRPARGSSSGMPASSIFVRYSSMTDPSSSPSSLRIDSICLRRKYSRCCFSAPSCTSSRMRRRTCSSARRSRWSLSASSSRSVTSSAGQQLDLLLERQVGRVARCVGQRAGLDDRAQELRYAAVVAAQLEDLLDHRAVLALEVAGAAVDRLVVRALLDLDDQPAAQVGVRRAGDAAVEARRARRRARRRAGARVQRPRRPCRPRRTRRRGAARAARARRRRRRSSA